MILLTTDAGGISANARRELDAVQDAVKAASAVGA
jgi:hypothetical protein